MKYCIIVLLLSLTSCWIETDPEAQERREKEKAEAALEKEVSPIVEDYFDYCYEGDIDRIFASYSTQHLQRLEKLYGGQKALYDLYEKNKLGLKTIGENAEIKRVKFHGRVYAIVEIDSVGGEEYFAMIRQDRSWKIHYTSSSRFELISSLR